jgi:hypothetical protein
MDLIARIQHLLLDPKSEWNLIASERTTPGNLITGYVAILAAIPVICGFIGTSIIGVGGHRTPVIAGIVSAVSSYALSIAGVFIMAFVIDFLADKFGGQRNFLSAMKVAAYAPTAGWLAGVFTAIPILSIFSLLGLYTFYLFYTGLPILMKVPEYRATGYLLTVMVSIIIIWSIIMFLPARLFGV